MAAAVIAVTVTDEIVLQNCVLVLGTLQIGPLATDTYATGGILLDKTRFYGKLVLAQDQHPKKLIATGKSGYFYEYSNSTDKLQIRTGAAAQVALTEFTAGALNAAIAADVVEFWAIFPKLQ